MRIEEITPVIIYDNTCHLCAKFANVVDFFARGKIALVGHYSETGKKLQKQYLDSSATDMFWFIDGKNAHGGRAALLPLIRQILFFKKRSPIQTTVKETCDAGCKESKAVFVRSASLFTHSKKIKIR